MECQPPLQQRTIHALIRTLEAQQHFREKNKQREIYRGSRDLCIKGSLAFQEGQQQEIIL